MSECAGMYHAPALPVTPASWLGTASAAASGAHQLPSAGICTLPPQNLTQDGAGPEQWMRPQVRQSCATGVTAGRAQPVLSARPAHLTSLWECSRHGYWTLTGYSCEAATAQVPAPGECCTNHLSTRPLTCSLH
jgi:hypothetical protein